MRRMNSGILFTACLVILASAAAWAGGEQCTEREGRITDRANRRWRRLDPFRLRMQFLTQSLFVARRQASGPDPLWVHLVQAAQRG